MWTTTKFLFIKSHSRLTGVEFNHSLDSQTTSLVKTNCSKYISNHLLRTFR